MMSESFLLLPILLPVLAALALAGLRNPARLSLGVGAAVTVNTFLALFLVREAPKGTLALFRLSPSLD